jgi:hypothetical protein
MLFGLLKNHNEESNELRVAKSLIAEHFSFLKMHEYLLKPEIIKSSVFDEYLEVKYVSEKCKREVTIIYNKGEDENTTYGFSTSIVRLPYKTPWKDYFSVDVYLNSIGLNFETTIENEFDEREAEAIVKKLAEFTQDKALKLVKGLDWIEGYYPQWK